MMERKNNLRRRFSVLIFTSLFTLAFMLSVAAGGNEVSNFAGTGSAGKNDGALAEASFYGPSSLAVDAEGGIIVADSTNNLIRKITSGKVTTIAGVTDKLNNFEQPKGGFADGNAMEARFNNPRYVTVSPEGYIYISDTGSNLIRKLAEGQVTTVAGIGKPGYVDGERTVAAFNCPLGLAVDENEIVYVADSLNHVIRAITPSGKISTFAGKNGAVGGYKDGNAADALFNEPSDLAFGKDGALYVLDSGNQMVRKIFKGKVTTICGKNNTLISGTTYITGGLQDGYGVDAKVSFPKGLFVDENGTVFIADTWNNVIRAILKNGKMITLAGTGMAGNDLGSATASTFNGPSDVVLIGSKLYVSDLWNNSIREITLDPKNLTGVPLKNPAFGINFKKKAAVPQIWVTGNSVTLSKKDFSQKGTTLCVSIQSVGKAFGGKVVWNKGASNLTITKADKTFTFNVKAKPVIMVSGVPMMDIRLLADTLELDSYSVPEYNAMVLYVK